MVVVHVLDSVLSGGVGAMARSLILEQYKAGKKPVLVCQQTEMTGFRKWCDESKIKIPFYGIEAHRRKYMTIFGGLSAKTEKQIMAEYPNDDIVYHFHNPIACGLLFACKGKSICTIHGFVGKISGNKISNLIVKKTIANVLKKKVTLVGCCNAVANYCNANYRTNRVLTVMNGLQTIKEEDRQYITKNEKCHIGYAATIDELKGWRILAEAYGRLTPNQREQCDLYFAGEISSNDRVDFERFVSDNKVHYMGYVPKTEKTFIPFLDVLVLPSRTEGLPMSILEAMQVGVVPIATHVGGIPELIENECSGYLIDRDANELAEILGRLISDRSLLEKVKHESRRRFEEVGTAEIMEKNYCRVYEQL